jgi:hypothetical protein
LVIYEKWYDLYQEAEKLPVAEIKGEIACIGMGGSGVTCEVLELVVLTHTLHLCMRYKAYLAPTVFLAVAVPVALPVAEVAEELVLLQVAFLAVAMVAVAVLVALPLSIIALSMVRKVLQVVEELMVLS